MFEVPPQVGTDLHDRAMAAFEEAAESLDRAHSFITSIQSSYSHASFAVSELARIGDMADNLKLATKALRQ